ncbi:MAG: hypothetical protein DI547_16185 [Sphingobium sp.]|nr:MAG: hypothetical protein DI547_16185 [Sphingobium sp.]
MGGQDSGALVPFAYGDALVRVVEVNGAPWWVAGDVAKVLGYREAYHLARHLDDDEKGPHIVSTLGGEQEMTIISESGLYHAILKSRRPEAKSFRKWTTSEVLPAIRRNGFYAPDPRDAELAEQRADHARLSQRGLDELGRREATLDVLDHAVASGFSLTQAVAEAAEFAGCSQSTIWNWRSRVRMVPQADRAVALAPGYKGGGRQAEVHPLFWADLCQRLARNGAKVGTCIRQSLALARRNGWHPIPCARTLRRRVAALRALPSPLSQDNQ